MVVFFYNLYLLFVLASGRRQTMLTGTWIEHPVLWLLMFLNF